jgi:catechol 2,3-dioxygenase-like lactoylglutathione lyase family enzyme
MFDHVGLRVRDLEAAAQLYAAMLAPLGHAPGASGQNYAGFGPEGSPALWLHRDARGGGAHVALQAASRDAVKAFYEAGLRAGARDNGAPGLRTEYAASYYAAFLVDADGNNIEAVCMR